MENGIPIALYKDRKGKASLPEKDEQQHRMIMKSEETHMSIKRYKWCLWILCIEATLLLFTVACHAEVSTEAADMDEKMEEVMRNWRIVEIGGRFFNVYINQHDKIITIKGIIETWDEMDKVERYFKHRGPSDYIVNCMLDFEDR